MQQVLSVLEAVEKTTLFARVNIPTKIISLSEQVSWKSIKKDLYRTVVGVETTVRRVVLR